MNANAGIRMKRPAHPGGFVRNEIIDPLGLSVTRTAEVLGVTRATLSTLLNEHAHLSPEMAVRIEKAFGVSMDTLMRMQNSYDIAQARERGVADQGGAVRRRRRAAGGGHLIRRENLLAAPRPDGPNSGANNRSGRRANVHAAAPSTASRSPSPA